MSLGPYLKRIPGLTGIYFQRAVPRPLHQKLKKETWQFKASNTVAEALETMVTFYALNSAMGRRNQLEWHHF